MGWGLDFDLFFFFSHLAAGAFGIAVVLWQLKLKRQMTSRLTEEYFVIKRGLWWTQWPQGAWVPWLQNNPKSSPLRYHVLQLVWVVCADMLCFSPNRMIGSDQIRKFAVHYGQIWVFCPLLQRTLFRCGLFRWISANLSFAAMFFSEWRDFLLGILPNKPYFLKKFLTGLSWTWIFNLLRSVESEM